MVGNHDISNAASAFKAKASLILNKSTADDETKELLSKLVMEIYHLGRAIADNMK